MSGPALDPALAALDRHRVAYVLIGGFAAQQHGASRPTEDIDITPADDPENLARLAAALRDLDARIRVTDLPEGIPFDTSAEALSGKRAQPAQSARRLRHHVFSRWHQRIFRPDPLGRGAQC